MLLGPAPQLPLQVSRHQLAVVAHPVFDVFSPTIDDGIRILVSVGEGNIDIRLKSAQSKATQLEVMANVFRLIGGKQNGGHIFLLTPSSRGRRLHVSSCQQSS